MSVRPASDQRSGSIRRGLRGGSAALMVVAMAALLAFAYDRLDGPVALVQVSGELTAAERDRAMELVAAELPAGVLSLDAQRLHGRLVAESWVDAAAVRRRWPETLEVHITPQVAVARWRGAALLSSRGDVIEPLELLGADALPHLSGPDGSEVRVMEVFQGVAEVLRPVGLEIAVLELDDAGAVHLETAAGMQIDLGADRHAERLMRIVAVVTSPLRGRLADVEGLDARYDNGVAVAWRAVSLDPLADRSLVKLSIEGTD